MTRRTRVLAEASVAWRSFLRRRTAVFFTFLFPTILVVIFGALVRTEPGGGGLFAAPPAYYVPGYVAVVVLFTPLSRVSSTVARHRAGNRFEKLATTPLSRTEWLAAHAAVNVLVVGLAAALVVALVVVLTGAPLGRWWLLPAFLVPGVLAFCGAGALIGRLTDSRDGAVAASNTLALPLLFLSDTFVPPGLWPDWLVPLLDFSPLSYFARGARRAAYGDVPGVETAGWTAGTGPALDLLVLAAVAVVAFAVGARAIPRTE